MNDGAFDIADGAFVDKTVTFLEGKGPSGEPMSLVVERGPVEGKKTLAELVRGHVDSARRRLGGYSVLAEEAIEVVGIEGIGITARWRHDDALVYSRQAHIVLSGVWMIIAVETDMRDRDAANQTFAHTLATFRPRATD